MMNNEVPEVNTRNGANTHNRPRGLLATPWATKVRGLQWDLGEAEVTFGICLTNPPTVRLNLDTVTGAFSGRFGDSFGSCTFVPDDVTDVDGETWKWEESRAVFVGSHVGELRPPRLEGQGRARGMETAVFRSPGYGASEFLVSLRPTPGHLPSKSEPDSHIPRVHYG